MHSENRLKTRVFGRIAALKHVEAIAEATVDYFSAFDCKAAVKFGSFATPAYSRAHSRAARSKL